MDVKKSVMKPKNGVIMFQKNVDHIEIFDFPAIRVIGRTVRYVLKEDTTKQEQQDWENYHNLIAPIIARIPKVVPEAMVSCTFDYWRSDDTYANIYGVITPKGTQVPQECDYLDIPASLVVKGLLGEWLDETNKRLVEYGYHCGGGIWYNASLYIDGEPLYDHKGNRVGRLLSQICDIDIPT